MKQSELQSLIKKMINEELDKIDIKPFIQEAVSNALSNLISEGIKAPRRPEPKRSASMSELISETPTPTAASRPSTGSERRAVASRYFEPMEFVKGNNVINDILNETASSGATIPSEMEVMEHSILDDVNKISPDMANALTKDYSKYLKAMKVRT